MVEMLVRTCAHTVPGVVGDVDNDIGRDRGRYRAGEDDFIADHGAVFYTKRVEGLRTDAGAEAGKFDNGL